MQSLFCQPRTLAAPEAHNHRDFAAAMTTLQMDRHDPLLLAVAG